MGSTSDLETVKTCLETLKELEIPFEARVLSAHRTPDALREYVMSAPRRGVRVFIAAAGGAAALAGVVASHTVLPVIGIPMETKSLGGLDSLLSTVQMPAGIPVAAVAIGAGGATNAALLAASILGVGSPVILRALEGYRRTRAERVLAAGDPTANPVRQP